MRPAAWYSPAVPVVDLRRLPAHVAIIMDGNGRWAELRGRPRPEGHRKGSEAVRRTVRACRRLGISALSLYAFSEQNWDRPPEEVTALMELLRDYLITERAEIMDHNIRLRAVGRIDRLPHRVREVLDPLAEDSVANDGMALSLALSYGGREEFVDASRVLATRVAAGTLAADDITTDTVAAAMPSMDVGPVDLLIRTGGEQRISNFMLWGGAYAELYFSDALWPEYDETDLFDAIGAFQQRDRRFGKVKPTTTVQSAPRA